jgi:hypothetical protein
MKFRQISVETEESEASSRYWKLMRLYLRASVRTQSLLHHMDDTSPFLKSLSLLAWSDGITGTIRAAWEHYYLWHRAQP